jgi:hypothetical protein
MCSLQGRRPYGCCFATMLDDLGLITAENRRSALGGGGRTNDLCNGGLNITFRLVEVPLPSFTVLHKSHKIVDDCKQALAIVYKANKK